MSIKPVTFTKEEEEKQETLDPGLFIPVRARVLLVPFPGCREKDKHLFTSSGLSPGISACLQSLVGRCLSFSLLPGMGTSKGLALTGRNTYNATFFLLHLLLAR